MESLIDLSLRKVLEEKLTTPIFMEHFLSNMINPEMLTFPTLILIYKIYGTRLENFKYPVWFWNAVCIECDTFTEGCTREKPGTCPDCDDDDDDDEDNHEALAAEAMGFRKILWCDGSDSSYYEDDEYFN